MHGRGRAERRAAGRGPATVGPASGGGPAGQALGGHRTGVGPTSRARRLAGTTVPGSQLWHHVATSEAAASRPPPCERPAPGAQTASRLPGRQRYRPPHIDLPFPCCHLVQIAFAITIIVLVADQLNPGAGSYYSCYW